MNSEHSANDDPVIFRYTRKQAIEDGVLVDLSTWASETGFVIPVACTSTIWHQYIVPPDGTRELGQSERGRCHDLLWMTYLAIKGSRQQEQLLFEVIFLQTPRRRETVKIKVVCGPGDASEPVLTLMLPHED